jgi:hypothetical protein
MRRSLLKVMCVIMLLCVAWIVVSPDLDVEPTAFRFAVFAAVTLFLLRCAFKYARPALVFATAWLLRIFPTSPSISSQPIPIAVMPLRC